MLFNDTAVVAIAWLAAVHFPGTVWKMLLFHLIALEISRLIQRSDELYHIMMCLDVLIYEMRLRYERYAKRRCQKIISTVFHRQVFQFGAEFRI